LLAHGPARFDSRATRTSLVGALAALALSSLLPACATTHAVRGPQAAAGSRALPPTPPPSYVAVPVLQAPPAPARVIVQAPPPAGAQPTQAVNGQTLTPFTPTDSPLYSYYDGKPHGKEAPAAMDSLLLPKSTSGWQVRYRPYYGYGAYYGPGSYYGYGPGYGYGYYGPRLSIGFGYSPWWYGGYYGPRYFGPRYYGYGGYAHHGYGGWGGHPHGGGYHGGGGHHGGGHH
jgi:hypothetical protein